ncbi:hypothetical protein K470DRAFT_261401 [Piedraia hortae CBS 480.64]|uniref:Uncharacterized protein n=1 Tax=Piedraia hortae CBS 480.64 TaxID=1314780 RepID=A0A6A7CC20_9PEZI|nr:hypothetical protein K470DRAFT_261401 [Piedraia hortae CBS 480.64]
MEWVDEDVIEETGDPAELSDVHDISSNSEYEDVSSGSEDETVRISKRNSAYYTYTSNAHAQVKSSDLPTMSELSSYDQRIPSPEVIRRQDSEGKPFYVVSMLDSICMVLAKPGPPLIQHPQVVLSQPMNEISTDQLLDIRKCSKIWNVTKWRWSLWLLLPIETLDLGSAVADVWLGDDLELKRAHSTDSALFYGCEIQSGLSGKGEAGLEISEVYLSASFKFVSDKGEELDPTFKEFLTKPHALRE